MISIVEKRAVTFQRSTVRGPLETYLEVSKKISNQSGRFIIETPNGTLDGSARNSKAVGIT